MSKAVRINSRAVLDVASSIALIAAALTLIYRNVVSDSGTAAPRLEVPDEPLVVGDAPIRGSADADAVMIVYSDFQCPFCGRFTREVLPEIERRYVDTGQLALVFRHLPLPMHPQAMPAAVLAECAGQQGRFWDVHDRLFAETELTDVSLHTVPVSLGLDTEQLTRCVSDETVSTAVRASAQEASTLGIRGTPAFFLGTRLEDGRVRVARTISGARPAEDFAAYLDAMLAGESTGWWTLLAWLSGRD